ncbi:MAG: hypothetical protein ABSB19_05515 [Methylomonas sp.]
MAKTFKRIIFQAAGSDAFRIRLNNQTELWALLTLALAIVDKNDSPEEWLSLLEQPNYWHAAKLTRISPLLNKAVARLASHIPKTRNPANEGAPRFNKTPCKDAAVVSASEASLSLATIEGDAVLVGARFFFEWVFYLHDKPSSVLAMLLERDENLTGFLRQIGMDEANIKAWLTAVKQLPRQLSPLQAQVLLTDVNGDWLSLSPMYSVATASWLGQWRKEQFLLTQDDAITEQEGSRLLFRMESAEYGGTNARNVAAVLMDFSGKQQHPLVLPPPVRRHSLARLERLLHRPSSLIRPKALNGKILSELCRPAATHLTYQQSTEMLSRLIENLLDEALTDITLIRSLLDSGHEEAVVFQNIYHSLTGKHPNLQLIQAEANDAELKDIAQYITHRWLGSLQAFKGGGERYTNIREIVAEQLHAYQLAEAV